MLCVAALRAMRRPTEKVIAVQLLTLLVAVTALLLAQLLDDSHRGQAPAHLLSWRGITVSSASPWHSLRRMIHREFWTARSAPFATVAAKTPLASEEDPRGQ